MTEPTLALPERVKLWLARILGGNYGAFVEAASRIAGAFTLGVASKAISTGITVPHISSMSWWDAIGYSGVLGALSLITSLISIKITGQPSLLAVASRTLRARRDFGARPLHAVPIRPPYTAPRPGEHEYKAGAA